MTAAGVSGVRARPGNPFPGLRPFEPHESALFFGRDEQCDDLLTRLGRRRLVAVVGMSGSGKSSLVRAGLLPALDRGYLPSAGSSWHIAIFRPGSDPVANLTRALATRRLPGGAAADDDPEAIRRLLDASSLGLGLAAQRLLHDDDDSLLIVADQFEEIFRFGHIARTDAALDPAAACVDLLLNATMQEDIPVYVVLTMRSDYLGDCARFTGLPEALNDSQFLVPRMTRAQLRAAIESPVAVGGAQITPRLVQRLLHEIDDVTEAGASPDTRQQNQDQLPVIQHALMRMWDVSHVARERGEPIDLPHYEQPPVETLRHALDRHAEEVYQALPTDPHRSAARLVFQQLTDRDSENREVRRPTPLRELTAVALRTASDAPMPAEASVVTDVIAAFAAQGREFVVVNAQQDVDISHESFIRKWARLREWVDQEDKSRRVYVKLADVAASWDQGAASLYRGPELVEAERWWKAERPTQVWADRYDRRFDTARRFLSKSAQGRRLRRGLLVGNIALLVAGATAIAVTTSIFSAQARRAEAAAFEVRNNADARIRQLTEANRLNEQALVLERQGRSGQANALAQQAQQVQDAKAAPVLTSSELTELDRLRRQETTWRQTETDLRKELAAARTVEPAKETVVAARPEPAVSDQAELERLRSAEMSLRRETTELRQQLAAARTAAATATAAIPPAAAVAAAPAAPVPDTAAAASSLDASNVTQVVRDYQLAYQRLDAKAVVNVMPSAKSDDLERSFSQLRTYGMEIVNPQLSITGDTAVLSCVRIISVQPKVGARLPSRSLPTVFRLRRSAGVWKIESVEESR